MFAIASLNILIGLLLGWGFRARYLRDGLYLSSRK